MGDLIIFALMPFLLGWVGGLCAYFVVNFFTTPKKNMPTWASYRDWREQ